MIQLGPPLVLNRVDARSEGHGRVAEERKDVGSAWARHIGKTVDGRLQRITEDYEGLATEDASSVQ